MNLIEIFKRFPTHESCIEHLELARWAGEAHCPYCGCLHVAKKNEAKRQGRWNCHGCKSSFNVLAGTIFQKTKICLQKWFLAISLVLNAKKSLSSYQLARDLDLNQKTAWYMLIRIRKAMMNENIDMLQGIVEADECYIGGKPRKTNKRNQDTNNKRGRGTKKMPVLGVVERNGNVVAKKTSNVKGHTIKDFIEKNVDLISSLLITDEYKGYNQISKKIKHSVINHTYEYANGLIHTNSIEGFWALLKRAWFGSHHHYSKEYANHYIAEACYKYNNRNSTGCFNAFVKLTVTE